MSKRIFDQLMREKQDWALITSDKFDKRLHTKLVANNYGEIKQDINRLVHEARLLTSPNTDKLVDTLEQLEAYEQVADEMEDILTKLRVEARRVQDEQANINPMPTVSNTSMARMILNRPDLNKQSTQTMIDNLSLDDGHLAQQFSTELPENINDLDTLKQRLIEVRRRISELKDEEEEDQEEEEEEEPYELEVLRDIKFRLYKRREQLRTAQDIDPRQRETRHGRLFDRPGDVPLHDFARMKLEESTNATELKNMAREMDMIQQAKKLREQAKRRQ